MTRFDDESTVTLPAAATQELVSAFDAMYSQLMADSDHSVWLDYAADQLREAFAKFGLIRPRPTPVALPVLTGDEVAF